mgnify:CR=1 FL=1
MTWPDAFAAAFTALACAAMLCTGITGRWPWEKRR